MPWRLVASAISAPGLATRALGKRGLRLLEVVEVRDDEIEEAGGEGQRVRSSCTKALTTPRPGRSSMPRALDRRSPGIDAVRLAAGAEHLRQLDQGSRCRSRRRGRAGPPPGGSSRGGVGRRPRTTAAGRRRPRRTRDRRGRGRCPGRGSAARPSRCRRRGESRRGHQGDQVARGGRPRRVCPAPRRRRARPARLAAGRWKVTWRRPSAPAGGAGAPPALPGVQADVMVVPGPGRGTRPSRRRRCRSPARRDRRLRRRRGRTPADGRGRQFAGAMPRGAPQG